MIDCILDMDDVLTDFVRDAMRYHDIKNVSYADIKSWNLTSHLGVDSKAFWDKLGYDFWLNLNWHPSGKKLVEELRNVFGKRIYIQTSPCDTVGCVEGKVAWIKRELPDFWKDGRVNIGRPKYLAASPTSVLIDDAEHNIEKFMTRGGNVVTIPAPWNWFRYRLDDSGNYNVDEIIATINTKVFNYNLKNKPKV